MKANEIMTSAKRTFSKVGFGLQKKSPEILVGVGIVGAVASAILACKATTKAGAIVEESKNSLADIREAKENGVTKAGESYSEEDHKKDLAIAYGRRLPSIVTTMSPLRRQYSMPVRLTS